MKILVIDNYDSFVYNLVHYLEELEVEVVVKRNNQFRIEDPGAFDRILLSPGPGIPDEAGFLKKVIEIYAGKKPILGVCLGQQAVAEVFGGRILNLDTVIHGKATKATILVDDETLFDGLPKEIEVGRYHSWVVDVESLPSQLEITSVDEAGHIMSLRHREYDIRTVQFHPESVLTPHGKQIIRNWVTS